MVNRFENRCALNERLFSVKKRISLTLISLLGSYLIFFFSACLIAQRAMYVYLNGSTVRLEITPQDGMGREEGGGFRMGNTCIPVADSF